MQENGGSSRTEEGESPSVLAFFVSCPGTCNISAGMIAPRWLQACIDAPSLLSVSREHRHDLLALLSVFGKLGYNEVLIMESVKEDMVNESLVFQRYAKNYAEKAIKPAVEEALARGIEQGMEQGRSQGLEQGRGQGAIEMLLGLLETRFPSTAVRNLRPLLETIDDVEQLKQLAPAAASAENLETFLVALSH